MAKVTKENLRRASAINRARQFLQREEARKRGSCVMQPAAEQPIQNVLSSGNQAEPSSHEASKSTHLDLLLTQPRGSFSTSYLLEGEKSQQALSANDSSGYHETGRPILRSQPISKDVEMTDDFLPPSQSIAVKANDGSETSFPVCPPSPRPPTLSLPPAALDETPGEIEVESISQQFGFQAEANIGLHRVSSHESDAISTDQAMADSSGTDGSEDKATGSDDGLWQKLPGAKAQDPRVCAVKLEEAYDKAVEHDEEDVDEGADSDHDPTFSAFFPVFLHICSILGILLRRDTNMEDPKNLLRPFDEALVALKQILFKDMPNNLRRRIFLYKREIREGGVVNRGARVPLHSILANSENMKRKEDHRVRRAGRSERDLRVQPDWIVRREALRSRSSPLSKQYSPDDVSPDSSDFLRDISNEISAPPTCCTDRPLSSIDLDSNLPYGSAADATYSDGFQPYSAGHDGSDVDSSREDISKNDIAQQQFHAAPDTSTCLNPQVMSAHCSQNPTLRITNPDVHEDPAPSDSSSEEPHCGDEDCDDGDCDGGDCDDEDSDESSKFNIPEEKHQDEKQRESAPTFSVTEKERADDGKVRAAAAYKRLHAMGFDAGLINHVLEETSGEFELALELLLSEATDDPVQSNTLSDRRRKSTPSRPKQIAKPQWSEPLAWVDFGGALRQRGPLETQEQIFRIQNLHRFGALATEGREMETVMNLNRAIDTLIAEIGRLWSNYMTVGLCVGVYTCSELPLRYDIEGLCSRLEMFATHARLAKVVCRATARFDAIWGERWKTSLDRREAVQKIGWMPFMNKANVRRAVLEAALSGMKYRGIANHGMLGA